MKSALTQFCEQGVDATTIASITEGADLGKGTFYRHFQSKAEVLTELTAEAVDSLLAYVGAEVRKESELAGVLDHLLKAHTAFFTQHREEFVLLFQSRLFVEMEREDSEGVEEPLARYLRELAGLMQPFLPQGVSTSKVRRLACALAGYVSGFLSFGGVGMSPDELELSFGPLRRAFVAGSAAFLVDADAGGNGSKTVLLKDGEARSASLREAG